MTPDRVAEALAVLEAATPPFDISDADKVLRAAPALLKLARAVAQSDAEEIPGLSHDPDCDACTALNAVADAVLGPQ